MTNNDGTLIKSHARLTRGQLKYFSSSVDGISSIYYLDTNSGNISLESIKTFNTSRGLFSYNTEQKMNKIVERHFHIICDRVDRFSNGEVKNFKFSKKDYSTLYEFANLALLRNPLTLDQVNETSLASLFLGPISQDFLVSIGFDLKDIGYLLNGYKPTILVNRSSKNLILPSTSYFASAPLRVTKLIPESRFSIVLPISPKAAIVLLDKTDFDFIAENGQLYFLEIMQNEDYLIDFLNIKAFEYERNLSGSFIVGYSKEDLMPFSKKIASQEKKLKDSSD